MQQFRYIIIELRALPLLAIFVRRAIYFYTLYVEISSVKFYIYVYLSHSLYLCIYILL